MQQVYFVFVILNAILTILNILVERKWSREAWQPESRCLASSTQSSSPGESSSPATGQCPRLRENPAPQPQVSVLVSGRIQLPSHRSVSSSPGESSSPATGQCPRLRGNPAPQPQVSVLVSGRIQLTSHRSLSSSPEDSSSPASGQCRRLRGIRWRKICKFGQLMGNKGRVAEEIYQTLLSNSKPGNIYEFILYSTRR